MIFLTSGSIGQIQGPFTASDVINFDNKFVKLGIIIGEKDLMTYEDTGFFVEIDGVRIKFGRDGIYELDDTLRLGSISFPSGAPASLLIDYVIMNE